MAKKKWMVTVVRTLETSFCVEAETRDEAYDDAYELSAGMPIDEFIAYDDDVYVSVDPKRSYSGPTWTGGPDGEWK